MDNPHAYRVYLILSGASTLFNAMMFTMMTVYYVRVGGLNPLQLVLVGTVMEVTEFLFEVPTGIVADTYGRRLSVIIGIFVTGSAFLLVALVNTFPLFALGSIIFGVGATFLSGAREAWIVDEVGREHVRNVFLRTTQLRRLAALLGTFISAGLATIALYLPILLGAVLTILLGVYLIVAMPETAFRRALHHKQNADRTPPLTLSETIDLIRRQPLLPGFLAIALLFGMYIEAFDRLGDAHFLLNFTLPAWGDLDAVLWFGIITAGSQVLGFVAAGVAARWHGEETTTATVHVLSVLQFIWVICAIGFALASNFALALLAYWSVAVISTIHSPIYDAWVNQYLESSTRATSLSVINQADALGQLVGGPAIGAIGTIFSLRVALVVAALVLSPILVVYQWALGRRGQKSGG